MCVTPLVCSWDTAPLLTVPDYPGPEVVQGWAMKHGSFEELWKRHKSLGDAEQRRVTNWEREQQGESQR